VPIPVRDLEAAAVDADRTVAPALATALGSGEGEAQGRAVRTRPRDVGAGEEAREGRFADLRVKFPVVLLLHPRLGDVVQDGEGEVGDVLEHGEEPAFDLGPEVLLLAVLIR
jgi:hypothetical protein